MTLAVDVARRFTATGAEPFDVAVDLTVTEGETLVVLGPSGSGKTLLLEAVAGFHDHRGSVALDGRELTGLPPEDRGFGFVFQDYALFPHMTARENVAFGARYHDDARGPDDVLAEVGVADLADRRPPTLSGGEAQRVALARSLAVDPDALLLDEPLSALDVPTRQALREDLADLLADATALAVTHDRTTARALADRIAVMRDGRVVRVGTPEAVFEDPGSAFVARFTGANVLRADDLPPRVRGPLFDGDRSTPPGTTEADSHLAIRPEYVRLVDADAVEGGGDGAGGGPALTEHRDPDGARDPDDDRTPVVRGSVASVTREDAAYRVRVEVGGTTLDAFVDDPPAPGSTVGLALPPERVTVVSADDESG